MERLLRFLAPFLVWAAPVLYWMARWSPYFHIPQRNGAPYMDRYWLVYPRWFTGGWGVRIHNIRASDEGRELHDHPWPFYSVILRGGYFEILEVFDEWDRAAARWRERRRPALRIWEEPQTGKVVLGRRMLPGAVNVNGPGSWHRIRLRPSFSPDQLEIPALTFFVCGPKNKQGWGFLVDGKKVPWRDYYRANGISVEATERKLKRAWGGGRWRRIRDFLVFIVCLLLATAIYAFMQLLAELVGPALFWSMIFIVSLAWIAYRGALDYLAKKEARESLIAVADAAAQIVRHNSTMRSAEHMSGVKHPRATSADLIAAIKKNAPMLKKSLRRGGWM